MLVFTKVSEIKGLFTFFVPAEIDRLLKNSLYCDVRPPTRTEAVMDEEKQRKKRHLAWAALIILHLLFTGMFFLVAPTEVMYFGAISYFVLVLPGLIWLGSLTRLPK